MHYGDAAVGHRARRQQWGTEVVRQTVQHGTGVWLIKQQRLAWPVQQQADPPGSRHDPQGHLLPRMAKGIVTVKVGQHPRVAVVAQPGLVPGAFALQRGVADPDLESSTLAYVHHPAVGAGGQRRGAERIGPRIESCWVVGQGLARFFVKVGQGAGVVRQGQARAHCALIKLQVG